MTQVILKVIQGSLNTREFSFSQRTTCIVGRAADCNILLPDDQAHNTISRYHCLIDINPPQLCIRDFGSLNGTYVNDEKIGQRDLNHAIDKAQEMIYPEYDLHHGDRIKLGDSVFQVLIEEDKNSSGCEQISVSSAFVNHASCDPLDKIKSLLLKAEKDEQQLMSIRGYKLLKELGKGSMGAVYLAKKEDTQQQKIALKVMLPKVKSDPKAHQQFIRETKNTKLLNHKYIVQVYDIGCYDDTFFFTTDYCEAGNITQLITKNNGKLPLFQALKILLQILDGLEFAHTVKIPVVVLADGKKTSATGLVHRDLKPGNILLTRVNNILQIKIADFGLAKAFDLAGLSGRTATGVSAGTPYYMPRQQVINFKFAKPEVDVWAAVAIFYKMFTGRYPRKYNKDTDPWLTTLKVPVTPISEYESSLPKALAEIIDKALYEQPQLHYKSALQLKNDILKVI